VGAGGFSATDGAEEGGADGAGKGGSLAHAASTPRIAAARSLLPPKKTFIMGLLVLEALGALAVFVLIVWWTMFSGRKGGERRKDDEQG
jgi:hypothetical protein